MALKRTAPQPNQAERPSTETQPPPASWTTAQKIAILEEYESYPRGDPRRGQLLRRVGAYTSHISKWREQRERGMLSNGSRPSSGRPKQPRDPQQKEISRLRSELARLQSELDKATTIIDVQKKLSRCLGWPPRR